MPAARPTIAITCDIIEHKAIDRYASPRSYADAVHRAGGFPVLVAPIPGAERDTLDRCDGFLFTGGDDPVTEPFGEPTHPAAVRINPDRQAFETALLSLLASDARERPVLGVCLGMQLMALCAGGRLDQHMPDTTPTHAEHWDADHAVTLNPGLKTPLGPGVVRSRHRQAVSDPGALRVIASAHDGVIEAIDDPARHFYLGVQWHPERTPDAPVGQAIVDAFIAAARQVRRASTSP